VDKNLGFYLNQAINAADPVDITGGASGYFSAPQQELDHHIFSSEQKILPEVRQHLLDTLYQFWRTRYHLAVRWSTIWLAGSGASYQWAADRGNGDLDILIGVDFSRFVHANPDYAGLDEYQMADHFDAELKAELWPWTVNTEFNGQKYEVTYFVNADAEDIETIHPYAAYNLSTDTWTVRPPDLPADPRRLYPDSYWKAVDQEKQTVAKLVDRYNSLVSLPRTENNTTALKLLASQAHTMFDDIHLGRTRAFAPGGEGYSDYHNFRWQVHKGAGTAQALLGIAAVDRQAIQEHDKALYGAPIASAHEALARAALWASRDRRAP
jgi:hypothetical protein